MHPIERLRYVARASGVPQHLLVRETAGALASFGRDPHGLVTACRRMLARQSGSAPLFWLASRVLSSADPLRTLRESIDALEADRTAVELAHALPDGASIVVLGWPDVIADALRRRGDIEAFVVDVCDEGSGFVDHLLDADVGAHDVPLAGLGAAVAGAELVLLESVAVGPDECLAVAGSRAAAAVAAHAGVPVWLVAGVGRLLPAPLWRTLRGRVVGDPPWDDDDEIVPLDLVTAIVGPDGPVPTTAALQAVDCPVAPELLTEPI